MIVVKIPTQKDIESIYFNDKVFNRIADDATKQLKGIKDINFIDTDKMFLGAYIDDKVIAILQVEPSAEVHFSMLQEYKMMASKLWKELINRLGIDVWAQIPTYYKAYINLAKKNGFEENGYSQDKVLINGSKYDKLIMKYKV